MKTIARLPVLAAAILALGVWSTSAPPALADDKAAFSDSQKQALDDLIRDYIMRHPEVIMESLQSMQQREQMAQQRLQAERVAALGEAIERDPGDPVLGNPDGDVTLVEFFDYQCGYCKRMLEPLINFANADGNLRIVMKEFPILGPESMIAARASLAAAKQGKYEAFHTALMGLRGRLSEPAIFQTALEVGLDTERLRKDMESPEVTDQIRKARELGEALSVRGTPAFIIDGTIVPGAISEDRLADLVAQARAKG
ncbi:MAG: DsbA family protein [Alphaproteobacteria bacterium]|jgi:protein-disulfide isomerase|nr:DsbA family protein [Alphaproteobacteria bacterium]